MREIVLEMGLHHWRLQPGRIYVVGNDVMDAETQFFINLKENGVAARHALLNVSENGMSLVDLLSATGTYLNETRLEPLSQKDIGKEQTTAKLRFGSVEIKYKTICGEESLDSSGFHDGPKNADKSNSSIIPETQMIENANITTNDNNDENDDSCIPETQFLLPPSCSRREPLLAHSTLSAKTANNTDGDIFRIGTQEFNENFFNDSEDDDDSVMASLIIPLVKHSPVILQGERNQKCTDTASVVDVDDEICAINCNNNDDAMSDRLLNTCTPDLFDIPDLTQETEKNVIKVRGEKQNHASPPADEYVTRMDVEQHITEDDELQPTQIFPIGNRSTTKESTTAEGFSQKENMLPCRTQSPKPAKLVESSTRSSPGIIEKKSSHDISLATTQIFSLQKLRSSTPATEKKNVKSNSLISDDKKKVRKSKPSLTNNITDQASKTCSVISNRDLVLSQATSSVCSEFDISCTPQLIKDLFDSKNSEVVTPLNTVAALQKKQQLFGADSDDDLVDILTAPKISHDFDALLPHLQHNDKTQNRSSALLKEKTEVEDRNNKRTHVKGRTDIGKRHLTAKFDTTKEPSPRKSRKDSKPKSLNLPLNDSKESKKRISKTRNGNVNVETKSAKNIEAQVKDDVKRYMRSKSCIEDNNNDTKNNDHQIDTQPARRMTRSKSIAVSKEENKKDTNVAVQEECFLPRVTRSRPQSGAQSNDGLPQQNQVPQLKRRIASINDDQTKRSRVITSSTSSKSETNTKSLKLKVCTTMVNPEVLQPYEKQQSDVYTFVKDPLDSNLLVMDKGNRTFKFLIAMARGIPIVTSNWLQNAKHDIPHIAQYIFTDAHFERRHHFNMLNSLQLAKKQKIFDDYDFLCTQNVQPQPGDLSAIIKCAGGTLCNSVPTKLQGNRRLFLISSIEDKKHWHKYRRLNSDISIISTEAIMSSVMRQSAKPLDSHRLA